jgi:hypothetical protein
VALDEVLDDALGSASADLIAVLALHLLAVAILALGEASVLGLANVLAVATGILNEAPMICGS